MPRSNRGLAAVLFIAAVRTSLWAQVASTELPPIRLLTVPVARTAAPFGVVRSIRALSDGRVLVNDSRRQRLTLLDSHLSPIGTPIDSGAAYGTSSSWTECDRTGCDNVRGVLAYLADSTLFLDPGTASMVMIAPDGKIARTLAPPRPQDVGSMMPSRGSTPGVDALGRVIYRVSARAASHPDPKVGHPLVLNNPDSAFLVRADWTTHRTDTVATIRIGGSAYALWATNDTTHVAMPIGSPFGPIDDWAVLLDGTLAVIRGQDLHVEFITSDGRIAHGPRISYPWEQLNDSAKTAVAESVTTARKVGPTGGAGVGTSTSPVTRSEFVPLAPHDLPDYRPAFATGAARADGDDHLWLRTAAPGGLNGPVYDVIDRTGALIDRLQLPGGRTIAGFGPKGVVYLTTRDADGVYLEKFIWSSQPH